MTVVAAARPNHVLLDLAPGALVRDVVAVVGGAALTGAAAQVAIHTSLTPVPFTLQTMAVVLVGASLGSVRGLASMTLYLVAGGLGVPWFAGHSSGFGGPAFGYVVGFLLAALVVGAAAERRVDRNVLKLAPAMVVSAVLVYGVGTFWLAQALHIGAGRAFALGVEPFLVGDLLKLGLASLVLPGAWWGVRRLRGEDA